MVDYPQKIFSIHFPDKKVYIENTCKYLHYKMYKKELGLV